MTDPEPADSIAIDGLRLEAPLSTHGARVRYRARGSKGEPLVVDVVSIDALDEARRAAVVRLASELREATKGVAALAPIVRLGEARRGTLPAIYLATAELSGPTLAEHLVARREGGDAGRTLQPAITFLQPIAHALERLHARGQAHLMLSPSSIVVATGTRVLVDHGVAALLALADAPAERARSHGAPEQVDPALGTPSAFSDVFSLALVFMELVLGTSVFSSIAPSDYYGRLVDRTARPAFRDHGIGVSPSIDRVLARALAVDPRSRWPGAGAFWQALAEAVRVSPNMHPLAAPAPLRAEPEPAVARVRAFARGRESQILSLAVALGITVFGIETVWRARSRGNEPAVAIVVPSAAPSASVSAAPSIATSTAVAPSASAAPLPKLAMVPVSVGNVHFLVDRTEVTVADYRSCIDAGKCTTTREHGYGWNEDDPLRKYFVCNLHVAGRDRHPVNCVSWNQATSFCGYVGKRLPREREWELAAHGGTKSRFPWGRDTPACTRAVFARYGKEQWGCKEEPVGTAEVDAHPDTASPCGALDLAGNLWEWTADRDGSTASLRGGGWDSSESNLTTTSRIEQAVFNGDVNVGFRCVKDP